MIIQTAVDHYTIPTDKNKVPCKIACFITPHGFGHGARMTAVIEALQKRIPRLYPRLFTTVPEGLFAETLTSFTYHSLACDTGLVQKNGLEADLPTTIIHLRKSLPYDDSLIDGLAKQVAGCRLILCDIAPLGIAVAERAGIPSVLIENFTWDWIYRAYLPAYPVIQEAIDYFAALNKTANIHIRTDPACGLDQGDLHCGPIFRCIRRRKEEIRLSFHCQEKKMVLISMGGVAQEIPFADQLQTMPETIFIIAGQNTTCRPAENVFHLSRDSSFYHPDLINAVDLVVCKSGYSTVAECYQAGVPLATVGRTTFPESKILERFCNEQLQSHSFTRKTFLSGRWLDTLPILLTKDRRKRASSNGADTIAEYLLPYLKQ